MSHKGKNSAGSSKGKKPTKSGAESKSEDVLQAVVSIESAMKLEIWLTQLLTISLLQVLADSFQDRFRPFTVEKPRVCHGAAIRFRDCHRS